MKRFLMLLATLLLMTNAAFAMTGFVEMQTINGVYAGMLPDEVVQRWGQPLSKENNGYYFKPGGLYAQFYTNSSKVTYLSFVRAENNPQLVLQPSGVAIGMSQGEVIRRLGEPNRKSYYGWIYENDIGPVNRLEYVSPETVNSGGIAGKQTVSVFIRENTNSVLKIELDGDFYRKVR